MASSSTAAVTIRVVVSTGVSGGSNAADITEEFSQTTALNSYTTDVPTLSDHIFNYLSGKNASATPAQQAHVEVAIADDGTTNVPGVVAAEWTGDATLGVTELTSRTTITTAINALVATGKSAVGQ